ncbi:MAG: hypothetical protein H3C47_13765 [Candidatus Cloacimonetes bacterium]|nr:hypothetical protein [Candidatus Cloacimonadota bacterium]
MAIPKAVHTEINRHYASKGSIGIQTNRELVGAMSFEKQYEYGKKILDDEMKKFGIQK